MSQKIVICVKYGGFGLSKKAYERLGLDWDDYGSAYNNKRDDETLVEVVECLGEKANGDHASLKIVEIPDGIEWQIEEYDGFEWIAEKHRTWR